MNHKKELLRGLWVDIRGFEPGPPQTSFMGPFSTQKNEAPIIALRESYGWPYSNISLLGPENLNPRRVFRGFFP